MTPGWKDKVCSECDFFGPLTPNGSGRCRRYPPFIRGREDLLVSYPFVQSRLCACGEFKQKEGERE